MPIKINCCVNNEGKFKPIFYFSAKDVRKLTFMYLANDVIQNGKKKGSEFGGEFEGTLKRAFEHMSTASADERTKQGLLKILKVWEERGVYDPKLIKDWRSFFSKRFSNSKPHN